MLQLIKKILELKCKTRWLRSIERERRKHQRLQDKANRQVYIVRGLIERYNELYKED